MSPIFLGLLAVSLLGCGPSLSSLVGDKHYREAICAAHDGDDADRTVVSNAIAADSELYLHVHTLTADELRPLLNDSTSEVMGRADFVRVRLRTNQLPIDALDAWVSIENTGGNRSAAAVGWDTLAWATRETLPARRRVSTYATPDNMLKGLGAVLTVGLSLPFTEFEPSEMEVDAPLSVYEEQAPLATSLHQAMTQRRCTGVEMPHGNARVPRAGRDCERFYVLEKGRHGRWQIVVEQRFAAVRAGAEAYVSGYDEEEQCAVRHVATMDLGSTTKLGETTRQRFGRRMRRVVGGRAM